MPVFYIAPEASIPYEFVSPTGVRAVLNDPNDPDFCGFLDGEEALSGIESPDVRDSFSELADRDGAIPGTNYRGRRPVVLNGRVIPSSASDRNQKLGKLMAATDAYAADGTMSWTPSGGEPVFLKFRRQLPFRSKGGFNKEFQIGLIANDPRIYTRRLTHIYTETNGNSAVRDYRRFTYSSGSGVSLGTRNLYLPPGTWKFTIPVKQNIPGARTFAPTLAGASVVSSGNLLAPVGTWGNIERTFLTTNAENVASSFNLALTSALAASQYMEVGDIRVESAAGLVPSETATFAGNWVTGAGYTMSFQSSDPPPGVLLNIGNAIAPVRQRLLGPLSAAVAAATGSQYVRLNPASAYGGAAYAIIDYGFRTARNSSGNSVFGDIDPAQTTWGGLPPDAAVAPLIYGQSGCSTATRMETTFRGVWL